MSLSDKIRTDRPEGIPSISPADIKQAVAELKETIENGGLCICLKRGTKKVFKCCNCTRIDEIFGEKLTSQVVKE